MHKNWRYVRIDELGNGTRPVLKAGPFGSAITKSRYSDQGFRVYGQQEVVSGNPFEGAYFVDENVYREHESCDVQPDDLLITMMGTVGRILLIPKDADPGIINPRLMRLCIDKERAEPEFIAQVLSSLPMQRLMERRAQGGTMPGLNADALASIELLLPPTGEQRRITAILRTWDEAIQAHERLIERKGVAFEYLALSLLTGHRRTNHSRSHWASVTLTEATTEITIRNNGRHGPQSVMGVNKVKGMIPMKDHVRALDLSRYKIVPPNAFAYNPMRLNIGSLARNEHGRDVVVSPDYVVFAANDGELDPFFFDHLRRTRLWSRFVENAGSGGVRVRIYYDDLADFEFNLPPIDEQRQISAILDTAGREIELLRSRRDALDRQKRGLMQKLLTGEWRVGAALKEAAE